MILAGWLEGRVKDHLLEKSRKATRERLGTVGLSQVGKCVRQLGYHREGKIQPEPYSWKMHGAVDDGHDFHKKVEKWLKRALRGTHFQLTDVEKEVYYSVLDKTYVGHVDGILTRLCLREPCEEHADIPARVLLEFKSCKDYEFRLAAKGDVSKEYRSQHSTYMAALNLRTGIMIYREKASGEMLFLPTEFDAELMKEVHARLSLLTRSSSPDQLPREYGPDKNGKLDWHCAYCPYVMECWKAHNPRVTSNPGAKLSIAVDT